MAHDLIITEIDQIDEAINSLDVNTIRSNTKTQLYEIRDQIEAIKLKDGYVEEYHGHRLRLLRQKRYMALQKYLQILKDLHGEQLQAFYFQIDSVQERSQQTKDILRGFAEPGQLHNNVHELAVAQELTVGLTEQKGEEIVQTIESMNVKREGESSAMSRRRTKKWCYLIICMYAVFHLA